MTKKYLGRAVLCAALLGVAAGNASPSFGGALAGTGRINLTAPVRQIDTRAGAPGQLTPNADYTLPAGRVITLTLTASTIDGSATVHPCGGVIPAGSAGEIVYSAGLAVSRQLVIEPGVATCLRPTSAVHLIVDVRGTVVPTSTFGFAAYVALPAPVEVARRSITGVPVAQQTSIPLPLPTGVPASAVSVVYEFELVDAIGYGLITNCGGVPDVSDLNGDGLAVVYRNLPASTSTCALVYGSGEVRVRVLGWLETTTPEATAVPPKVVSRSASVSPPGFAPIPPKRVLDTRTGVGTTPGKLATDEVIVLDLSSYVTAATTSVVMNVTVTGPDGAGFVTVFPCEDDEPNASNLNFAAGQDVPNLVAVRLGLDAEVCFVTSAETHVLADLAGTFEVGGGSLGTAVSPERILDTRSGVGAAKAKIPAGGVITLQIAGRGGVSTSGASAVAMNLTVSGATSGGYITAYPCDQPRPDASNLNFVRGVDVPNLAYVKLSPAGTVCLYSTASTDLIGDVAMWFGSGGQDGFFDVSPTRRLDSRSGPKLGTGGLVGGLKVTTITSLANVHAVTMNVTATAGDGAGYLSVFPFGTPVPNVSNLNFARNQDIPNLVTVKVPVDGALNFVPSVPVHAIVDIAGFFSSSRIEFFEEAVVAQ